MGKKLFKKIYVEITNVCNFNCSFCLKGKRENRFMTLDEFSIIAKKISKYTDLIALHVKGEPLLHPNLKDILEICYENNLKVNITTNGSKIEECREILLNSKALRQINISLHSIEENDIAEDYKEIYLNKILNFTNSLKNTDIILSLRLWNISDLKDSNNSRIISKIANYFNINDLKELIKENKFVKLQNNIFLNQDYEFTWPENNKSIQERIEGTCQGLRNHIAILSNGDIVPCCLDQDGEINLGNLLKGDFLRNYIKK